MKKILIFIMVILITSSLFASYPNSEVQEIFETQGFRNYIEYMYNSPFIDNLESEYDKVIEYINNLKVSEDSKKIAKAQVKQLISEQLITRDLKKDGKTGLEVVEEGLDLINSIKNFEKNEEALIVKADLLGNYMIQSGSYVFTKGIESGKVIDKALKMNNSNPRSIIINSEKLMYAPGLFGGDKQKAKKQLRDLIENNQLLEKDAFEAIINLGILARLQNNKSFAKTYFSYAQAIFPDNGRLKIEIEKVK